MEKGGGRQMSELCVQAKASWLGVMACAEGTVEGILKLYLHLSK